MSEKSIMKLNPKPLALAVTLMLVILSGCGKKEVQQQTITIGSILGLTGNNAAYGQKMQRGFNFALEEINSKGGISGTPIRLIAEDSQFDPNKAVSAYRKLTGIDGVKVIVGVTGSKNAIPVCEAAKSDNVVIIDALGTAPKLTTAGGPNYFRVIASDALAGKYNVAWASESGMKKPAVVYMEDDWGASYREAVLRNLRERAIENPSILGVTAGTLEFRTQIQRLKTDAPDTVFLLLYAKEGSAFVQQLRQAGIKALIYGSDNISSSEFASAGADVVEGVRVAMPAPAHGTAYEEFVTRYKTKYGEGPHANIIKSYDAMNLAAIAVKKVGYEPGKIRDLLNSPNFEFKGVSGAIQFDEHGDIRNQEYIRNVYRAGALVPLE